MFGVKVESINVSVASDVCYNESNKKKVKSVKLVLEN